LIAAYIDMIDCQVFMEPKLSLINDGTVAYSRKVSVQEQQSLDLFLSMALQFIIYAIM